MLRNSKGHTQISIQEIRNTACKKARIEIHTKQVFKEAFQKQLSTKPLPITQPTHCRLANLQFAKQIPHRNTSEIVLHPTSLKVKIAAESLPNGWPEICDRPAGHTGRGIIHFEVVHDCCGSRLWAQNFVTVEDLQAVATHGIRPQRSDALIARKQEGTVLHGESSKAGRHQFNTHQETC
jgi:hypothetical protein